MWDVVRPSEPISKRGVCFPDIKDEDTPENTKKNLGPAAPRKDCFLHWALRRKTFTYLYILLLLLLLFCPFWECVLIFVHFNSWLFRRGFAEQGIKWKNAQQKHFFNLPQMTFRIKTPDDSQIPLLLSAFFKQSFSHWASLLGFFVCFSLFFTVLGEEKYI